MSCMCECYDKSSIIHMRRKDEVKENGWLGNTKNASNFFQHYLHFLLSLYFSKLILSEVFYCHFTS